MRSVILRTVLALCAVGLVPAAVSAHDNHRTDHQAYVNPAEACSALWIMHEVAQAEQGWYGHARTMAPIREAACGGSLADNRWPTGRAMFASGGLWYYPDGAVAIRGGTFYYPSGRPAYAGQTWRYPDGRVAHARNDWYYPDGRRAYRLEDMIDQTCGSYDPDCTRYLAGAQGRQSLGYEAAGMRFAWQSRASTAGQPVAVHDHHQHEPEPCPTPAYVAAPPVAYVPQYVPPAPAYVPPTVVHRTVVRPARATVEVRVPRDRRTAIRRTTTTTRRATISGRATFSAGYRY